MFQRQRNGIGPPWQDLRNRFENRTIEEQTESHTHERMVHPGAKQVENEKSGERQSVNPGAKADPVRGTGVTEEVAENFVLYRRETAK